ncbi:T9SS type A sorting domain-containing protein [candidate division KSB1 bacterium]|nr:T9SS type A sorting domain-containing protein [candidate division KSB1 bacterium]
MKTIEKITIILAVVFLAFCCTGFAADKTIYWISDAQDSDGDGIPSDQEWIYFLEEAGYLVNYEYGYSMAAGQGYWTVLDDYKLAELDESADLLIISRATNSGDYATDFEEILLWNSISTPILMQTAYIVRNSRWQWLNTGGIVDVVDTLEVLEPEHYIFKDVPMIEENKIAVLDTGWTAATTSFPTIIDPGYGKLLAARADTGGVWIVEWEPFFEFYYDTDQFPEGRRMFFALGETGGSNTLEIGYKNTTEAGDKLFLNAVKYLLGDTLDSKVQTLSNLTPAKFHLAQNYPNPFNPVTSISYALENNDYVALRIFDTSGRQVAELVNELQAPGVYKVDFDASKLNSGIYFYQLATSTDSQIRKMTLIK